MESELERFRNSAADLISLDLGEREKAFHKLLDDLIPALEAQVHRTGDMRWLVDSLAEIWRVGFEIGVMERPPAAEPSANC